MRKVVSTLLLVFILMGVVICSAQAASYPSVYFYSDADFSDLIIKDTATVGDTYSIRMVWYAVYNNEGYDISIYDSKGSTVATAYKTWTNGSYSKRISITWNTSGLTPGSYKIVVKKLFYSMYRWNEAPTTSSLSIDLLCNHNWVIDPAVEPTCTSTGLTEGRHCSICNMVEVRQEVVPAKGHVEVDDPAVEPTCTTTGLTAGKHCVVCGEVLVRQEVIPANGHTEVIDPGVEPTYDQTGLTEGKHCSVCGEVLVPQEVIPKLEPTSAIVKGLNFKLNNKTKVATVTGPQDKTVTSIIIPATIRINNNTYKVTAVASNAFKGCKMLTKLTIGQNIVTIGKNAFYGCKKLNVVTFKTTTLKTVGANAFKGINAKAIIKCPKAKKAAYQKLLSKRGVPKTATFK